MLISSFTSLGTIQSNPNNENIQRYGPMSQHLIEERLSDRSALELSSFWGDFISNKGWRGAETEVGTPGQAGQPRDGEDRAGGDRRGAGVRRHLRLCRRPVEDVQREGGWELRDSKLKS